jgi:hypothetical protein
MKILLFSGIERDSDTCSFSSPSNYSEIGTFCKFKIASELPQGFLPVMIFYSFWCDCVLEEETSQPIAIGTQGIARAKLSRQSLFE